MKDVPTALPPGLEIAAICEREDVRDALVSRGGLKLDELPRGARVGTSSLRRQAQLRHHRADLVMVEMRGNVDTRLAKVAQGDYDAIVLAKAGLERLGRADQISEVLPPSICLPAAGQGAIGIEMRAGDEFSAAVRKLNHRRDAGRRGGGARRARRPRKRLPGAAWEYGRAANRPVNRVTEARCVRAVGRWRGSSCAKPAPARGKIQGSWALWQLRRSSSAAPTACFGSWDGALNTVKARTLAGRRVIVTRAPEQSKELVERLEELGRGGGVASDGAFCRAARDTADLDQAIRSLDTFDWLIFTSANAVTFFLGRCRALECWPMHRRAQNVTRTRQNCGGRLGHRTGPQEGGLAGSLVPREFSGAGLGRRTSRRRREEERAAAAQRPRQRRVAGALAQGWSEGHRSDCLPDGGARIARSRSDR